MSEGVERPKTESIPDLTNIAERDIVGETTLLEKGLLDKKLIAKPPTPEETALVAGVFPKKDGSPEKKYPVPNLDA